MMNLEDLEYDKFGDVKLESSVIFDHSRGTFEDLGDYLNTVEKEIATQLIRDGYLGTFDELLMTVRKLANE